MKKPFLSFLLMGMAALFALTSCLQNEEPAGIENLRNAKSELIRAEAAYKVAEIALIEADKAMKDALTAGTELDNKLKEQDLLLKELDVQLKTAQVEYEKKALELKAAEDAAASEVELERLKAELLAQQNEQARLENEKTRLENEKELIAENHKKELLEAQKAVADAELAYQKVLDEIESVSKSLTKEEKTQLAYYKGQVETIRQELATAQGNLIDAQEDLVDAKYAYDKDLLKAQYERTIENRKLAVTLAQEAVATARAIDLDGGAGAWQAQIEELEADNEKVEAQITDVRIKAKEKAGEKVAPQAEIDKLYAANNDINDEITALREEIYELNGRFDYNADYSFEIPARLQNNVRDVFVNAANEVYNQTGRSIQTNVWFEDDSHTYQYYIPDNVLTYNTSLYGQYAFLCFLETPLQETKLSDEALRHWNEWLVEEEYKYNESENSSKALFEKYDKMFGEALAEFKKLAAEYGYVRFNSNNLKDENLLINAQKAYENLAAATEQTTSVQKTEWIDAIRKEQEIRDKMVKTATDGWNNFTYENFVSDPAAIGHITLSDLYNAVANSSNNPVIDYDGTPTYNYVSDEALWSAAQKWNVASGYLYGISFMEVALTTADYAKIEETVFNFDNPVDYVPRIWFNQDFYNNLESLGISNPVYLRNYLWLENHIDAKRIEYLKDIIDNYNTDHAAMMATFEALNQEFGSVMFEEYEAKIKELQAQIAEKENEGLDNQKLMAEQQKLIDAIDAEIDMMTNEYNPISEVSLLQRQIDANDDVIDMLEGLVSSNYIEIDGRLYEPNSPEAETALQAFVARKLTALDTAEQNLADAEDMLTRLNNGEDAQDYLIQKAEAKVKAAQEEYDALLEEFNFYNGLMKDLMAAIIGGTELPEPAPQS